MHDRRPSILQITTHDSGRHFGCYGHDTLDTPNVDALAADGVRFSNLFSTVPICSASRASMLTGLYPQSHGLMDLTGFGWRITDGVPHLSQLLKRAGYQTHLFGFQHEAEGADIARLAFDRVHPGSIAADAATNVARFLLNGSLGHRQPFYAQVGFVETHVPFGRNGTPPDRSKGLEVPPYVADTPAGREAMAGFQGAVRAADAAVGRIMDALRRSGLEENTLVVFTTDHGIEMPRAKWFLYDPGIAIAMIMRHPAGGLLGGRTCDLLLSNVDYLPSVLELIGVGSPHHVQGRSFAAQLGQDDPVPVRDAVFGLYHKTRTRCVRTRRFKLIRHFAEASDFCRVPVPCEDVLNKKVIHRVELFDLDVDPNEFQNVADQAAYADVQQRLETMLWQWMEAVDDPLLRGPVRTPSYESAIADYARWRANVERAGSG